MKTVATNVNVERGGVQAESTFTIKATSKAFDILSSGLYSDKVRAIVRELSCNAHDSHVAAGKADLPIEIKLPSVLDQTFHVKDFGTGLSDEQIQGKLIDVTTYDEEGNPTVTQQWQGGLYRTYFESTKTESDDFIGQLGLGSKSPFSYAPTFTVESRFNGVKRVYTCFKNETGMPAISLMGEEETDEINGVTVALSVKRDDIDKFNDAARKVFMYFDPVPKVLGYSDFTPYHIKHTIKGTNWKIRETDYSARMTGPYVVQGFVAYPLDGGILAERNLSASATKLLKTNLDLYVEIGQVEVAASREALSYDSRTIDNLVKVVEQVAVEMRVAFQDEFDKCTTKWEVAQLYGKFSYQGNCEFRSIFDAMHRNEAFTWNGAEVFSKVKLDLTNIKVTKLSTNTQSHRGKVSTSGTWAPYSPTKTLSYDIYGESLHVVVDKEAKGHHEVVRTVLNNKGGNGRVIMIAPTSKKLYDQKEVDFVIEQLGNPPVVYADTLNITRAKATVGTKRTAEEKLVWAGFPDKTDYSGRTVLSDKFSRKCWATETVVLEDGGFYVDLERFEPQYNGAPLNRIDDLIRHAAVLDLFDEDTNVYGIQKRDQKHIQDAGNWVNLVDHIKSEFTALNAGDALFNRAIINNVKSNLSRGVVSVFIEQTKYIDLLNDGPFKKLMIKLSSLNNNAPDVNSVSVQIMTNILGIGSSVSTKAGDLYDEWNNTISKYNMLCMINWSSLDFSTANIVIDYINLVDKV